jgi:hypothetical protein
VKNKTRNPSRRTRRNTQPEERPVVKKVLYDANNDVRENTPGIRTYTLPSGARVSAVADLTRGHTKAMAKYERENGGPTIENIVDGLLLTVLLDPETRWNYLDLRSTKFNKDGSPVASSVKVAKISSAEIDLRPAEDMDALSWELMVDHKPEMIDAMREDLVTGLGGAIDTLESAKASGDPEKMKAAIEEALTVFRSDEVESADPNDSEPSSGAVTE